MEVDAEMQRGLLPGALALSAKFVPAMRAVASRTAEVLSRDDSYRAVPFCSHLFLYTAAADLTAFVSL